MLAEFFSGQLKGDSLKLAPVMLSIPIGFDISRLKKIH
jgi:hypothetical protein